jgi:hypothetical protein
MSDDKEKKVTSASADADKDAGKSKCNEKVCIVRDLANKLTQNGISMENVIKMIGDELNEKVSSVQHTIIEDFKKPAKCVADVAGLFPSMIESTGNAIASAFDKIGNSAENMANKVAGLTMDDDGFPDIFAPFRIVYLSAVRDIQGLVAKIALGIDAPTILADPNMNPDKILQDILNTSDSYKKIVDSPAFKKMFEEWIQNYAKVLDKTIELGRPKIDGVTNKLTGIIDETSAKVGNALTNSLMNVITGALKAVPGVGAVVSIAEFLKKTGTKVGEVCEPPVTKGGLVVATVANAAANQLKNAECQIENLKKKLAPLLQSSQAGGFNRNINNNNINRKTMNHRKKITRATKRIKHMLGKFTKKRHSKLNYTARLNKLRHY